MPICWPPIPPMPMPMPPIPIPPIPMPIPPMPPMPPPLPPPLPPPIPMPPMPPYIPPMPYPPWPPMPMPPIPGGPDVQRLAADHLQVHLRDSLRRLLRGGEAHEAEALGRALVIADNLGRRDLTEGAEVLPKLLVVDALVEVLDVEVHALLRARRGALRVELLLQAERALGLGLGALHVDARANEEILLLLVRSLLRRLLLLIRELVRLMQILDGLLRRVRGLEVHERKDALLLVLAHERGGDGAELPEDLLDLVLVPALRQLLDVHVRELLRLVVAVLHLHEGRHLDGLLADLHPVHALDGLLRRVLGLEVHEPVALGLAVLIGRDLAGQDVAEQAERVVQGLVVDVRVEVLHEDVPRAGLAHRRVAVAPHDAAGAALDLQVVQGVQRALRVGDVVVVHVGVPERLASDRVTAHTDRGHRAHGVEDLVEDRLRHVRVDVPDVEGRELLHTGRATAGGLHGKLLAGLNTNTPLAP